MLVTRVEVRLLGPFEVLVDGEPVEVAAGRASTLLSALALSAGSTVSIEHLTDLVWGEKLPDNARRTVQTNVKRLRATLGGDAIQTRGSGYALDVAPADVDALRFVELLDAADADPAAERDRIVAALELWRGTPLMDVQSERLADEERPRLVERYLAAVERRIDLDLAAGRAAEVVAEARRVAGQYPLRESTWARLIVALDRSGRTAEALECYEAVRTRIADELGVDPGPELQQIHAALLRGGVPEATGSRAEQPLSEPAVPRQIPADIDTFTGRGDAFDALDKLLLTDLDGQPTIVALHGAGGIGKTALAVRWAHGAAHQFPDGQLYVNLQGFGAGEPTSPGEALEALLRGLGVPGDQLPVSLEARSGLLRTTLADRRVLMIVDNARDVEQVRPLLPGEGETMVIVTSRSQLRGLSAREGAHRIAVDTLPLDDATELLAAGLSRQRVAFDKGSLVDLADLCGRLPLALAVTVERAGRYPDNDLADLITELRDEQDRLDALDTGDDPLTNVRAVLSWSYSALDDELAHAFRLLGLHLGADISLPAAAALTGMPTRRARRALDQLVDVHLVQRPRPGRYAMHDLIRTYATELADLLDEERSRDGAVRRLLSWYVHSTYNANVKLRFGRGGSSSVSVGDPEPGVEPATFADYQQARGWFDSEWPTLVRAVSYAADQDYLAAAYRLASKSFEYLHQHRPPAEGVRLREIGRQAAAASGDRVAQGFLTTQLAVAYGRSGNRERELACLEEALELFRQEGHLGGEEVTLLNLGSAYRTVGRLADARRSLERALELPTEKSEEDLAGLTINLARVQLDDQHHEAAVDSAAQAVAHAEGSGHRRAQAIAVETLGLAHAAIGNHSDAEDCLRRALALDREFGYRGDEALVLGYLGRVERDAGKPDDARTSWQQALAIIDEIGEADSSELTRAELLELIASVPDA